MSTAERIESLAYKIVNPFMNSAIDAASRAVAELGGQS